MKRNKTVDDFLIADWIEAYTHLNKKTYNKLRRIALKSGIEVPAFVAGNSKPVVKFDIQGGLTDRYQRVHDTERVSQFKKNLEEWAVKVEADLRKNIYSLKKKDEDGKTSSSDELADSLTHKVHLDKDYGMEPRSIGFKFARHGVYWAKGAYKGHGGYVGSHWTDSYGRLKHTADSSRGLMGSGKRKSEDWFNPVIDKHIEELAGIALAYCGDMTLDLTRIHIR